MITTKKISINASSNAVWKIFATDFENAHIWMAGVPNSFGKELGKRHEGANSAGRVCELDSKANGLKAYETILNVDEKLKTMLVRITFKNAPFLIPIIANNADFNVTDTTEGKSEVVFTVTSELKPIAYLFFPLIKLGLGVFIKQIIEELKFYVENGTPHPRKLKAISNSK
jgi:hypothetical protein